VDLDGQRPEQEDSMNLKELINKSIQTNKPVKISPKLTLAAQEKNNQITIKLNLHGNLIWTDSNNLDNIVQDLDNEISNYG
jgi:hypothetical protein